MFTIAIASDLHCHLRSPGYRQESFLIAGSARLPSGRHPIQSLLELIEEEGLTADALVCPGDISNRASLEGLSNGVQSLIELKQKLKSTHLLCTLGNHDVDSRRQHDSDDPFALAATVHPAFPLSEEHKQQYWAEGFSVVECGRTAIILVLNSVADHTSEQTAKRGSFPERRLAALDKELLRYSNSEFPLRIAMLHHHPLLHSHLNFLSEDVLANGDQLITVLSKHRFDIIIHGHKHQPRLRRQDDGAHNMIVFAAGSFSAFLHEMSSTTRNLFHLIELDKKDELSGVLRSWEYNDGLGWSPTARKSSGFPFVLQFKGSYHKVSSKELADFILNQNPAKVDAEELYAAVPLLRYVLPDELDSLGEELERKYGLKFVYNDLGLIQEAGKISRHPLL